ncbi:hypothetical protein BDR26DRAFT_865325 [Obelidium mucronatum]|nr:hypothetical protein BDR26DRAFT_865325 [Obelidium mucronatum]
MEGALAAYQEAVTIFGSSCNYYSLGSCLQALGKIEEAVEAWKACVDIDFTYNAAHANLAHAYAFVLKKPELALNHYDIALFMNPEDGQTLFHCGVFFESMGKLQAATKMYEDAVANGIDHAQKKLESVRERLSAK